MKAVLRKAALLGALATAGLTVGCASKGTKDLEEQNRILQQACDDLRRRNDGLEKENAMLKGDDKVRDAYIRKLEQESALAKRINELLNQQGETPGIVYKDGKWELENDFFFRPGSDNISKEGIDSLKKLASVLKSSNVFVRVVGHTDTDPIKRTLKDYPSGMNLELGACRAVAVASELKKAGVEETRMHVISMGEASPVSTDKKKNRRVEIMVAESAFDLGAKSADPPAEKPARKPARDESK
jgi:flagellar motor protein MotB